MPIPKFFLVKALISLFIKIGIVFYDWKNKRDLKKGKPL